MNIGNKKIKNAYYIAVALLITALIGGSYLVKKNLDSRPLLVAFITDIHAGDEKKRTEGKEENNILIPENYEKNLNTSLEKMKREKVDLIVNLGDSLNSPSKKYPGKLKNIFENFNMPVIWTNGNHDKAVFSEYIYPKKYYYIDKGHWRIIVLDNSEANPDDPEEKRALRGYIDPVQMNWLRDTLKKTKKNVLVAMHVPMFSYDNLDDFRPDQIELKKILEESGKVKYVFAGHHHVYNFKKEENNITYYVLSSFSLLGQEGYYMTLNLE